MLGYTGNVVHDNRLVEVQTKVFDKKPWAKIHEYFSNRDEYFSKNVDGVESFADVRIRVGSAIEDILNQYRGKKVLVISHGTPLRIIDALSHGYDTDSKIEAFNNAEFRELSTVYLPRNEKFELDFHRPFIDDVVLVHPKTQRTLKRIPDVFDCWFESGSMPYGKEGYAGKPTCNTHDGIEYKFDPHGGLFKRRKGYPANFIAEGLDQTRGWFYSMLVLGVALTGKSPYSSVIVNGLVLAEDGRKMSKSLKNYTDPMELVENYGADSLRFYMLSSPLVQGEDVAFTDKGVDEVSKKIVNRLDNTIAFYEMYAGEHHGLYPHTKNVLDAWVVARVQETVQAVTVALDTHELNTATRPIADLIEDVSVWYIRRSRDRFKAEMSQDKKEALETSRYVFVEIAKLLAPFMPFFAEDVYARALKNVHGYSNVYESVHLETWSKVRKFDTHVLKSMKTVRELVTLGLELRMKANVKVRQPLQKVVLNSTGLQKDYLDVLKDELNVKEVEIDTQQQVHIILDTNITPKLKSEGIAREIIRALQDARKIAELNPGENAQADINISGEQSLLKKIVEDYGDEISRITQITKINFSSNHKPLVSVSIEGSTVEICVVKIK